MASISGTSALQACLGSFYTYRSMWSSYPNNTIIALEQKCKVSEVQTQCLQGQGGNPNE